MAEEKWVLQFNKAVVMGSIYNPGEKAAFTVRDAQMILNTEKVTNPDDPNFGKPPAEVIKKLSAVEVEAIEGIGQPIKRDDAITVPIARLSADTLRRLRADLEEKQPT